MLIYLASPYTHEDPDVRKARYYQAVDACAAIIDSGRFVYSPIVHMHPIQQRHGLPPDWGYWKRFAEATIRLYDELWVLLIDGWELSVGVAAEIGIAEELNIPVRYFTLEHKALFELVEGATRYLNPANQSARHPNRRL